MAKKGSKPVRAIATVLVAVAVCTFVLYVCFDAVGFGRTVTNFDSGTPTWGTNQTFELSFVPESKPTVKYWNATGTVANGTVNAANVTWVEGRAEIYVFHLNWSGTSDKPPYTEAYGKDSAYIMFDYTAEGSSARAMALPAMIILAIMGIVVVCVYLVSSSNKMGGKGKSW